LHAQNNLLLQTRPGEELQLSPHVHVSNACVSEALLCCTAVTSTASSIASSLLSEPTGDGWLTLGGGIVSDRGNTHATSNVEIVTTPDGTFSVDNLHSVATPTLRLPRGLSVSARPFTLSIRTATQEGLTRSTVSLTGGSPLMQAGICNPGLQPFTCGMWPLK